MKFLIFGKIWWILAKFQYFLQFFIIFLIWNFVTNLWNYGMLQKAKFNYYVKNSRNTQIKLQINNFVTTLQ
jgi:hypothetical protein